MTQRVEQPVRLRYNSREWKQARDILLQKEDKRRLTLVKSYKVIILLNCIGIVLEKVIAKRLSHYSENFMNLYQGQMGSQKERDAIGVVQFLVYNVEQH